MNQTNPKASSLFCDYSQYYFDCGFHLMDPEIQHIVNQITSVFQDTVSEYVKSGQIANSRGISFYEQQQGFVLHLKGSAYTSNNLKDDLKLNDRVCDEVVNIISDSWDLNEHQPNHCIVKTLSRIDLSKNLQGVSINEIDYDKNGGFYRTIIINHDGSKTYNLGKPNKYCFKFYDKRTDIASRRSTAYARFGTFKFVRAELSIRRNALRRLERVDSHIEWGDVYNNQALSKEVKFGGVPLSKFKKNKRRVRTENTELEPSAKCLWLSRVLNNLSELEYWEMQNYGFDIKKGNKVPVVN